MNAAYFDVSYLAKLHWREPGTSEVAALASTLPALACSFSLLVLPVLTIERAVILRWNCGQTLQGADAANGPWSDISGATPPSTIPATQAKAFYRVRN